jgi:hypothetical protein
LQPGVCSITNADTAGGTSAVVVSGSTFAIEDDEDITGGQYVSVTGNLTVVSATTGWDTLTLTSATDAGDSGGDDTITFRAGAVGSGRIFTATSSTAAATDTLLVTIVASCANDVFSAGNSFFTATTESEANDADGSGWTSTAVDSSGSLTVANGSYGYAKIRLNDAYNADLSTSGALIATVGSGCVVGLAPQNGTLVPGKSASAVLSTTGDDEVVIVGQATENAPASCTVSVTFGGVAVGSKTFLIQGAPAKVTVSDITVGALSGAGFYRVTVTDSAGNPLPGKVISASSTNANNVAAIASGVITAVQARSGAATSSTAGSGYGRTTAVTGANALADSDANLTKFTCSSSKSGTAQVTVRTPVDAVNSAYITSDPFTVACGGTLATWTISLDKATYAPGEIATLTLSGRDSTGNPVGTFMPSGGLSSVEYSFGGMTAVTAPTNGDYFTSGVGTKTYQFSVGTTEGAFVGTFKTAGSTDTSAKTLQYTIKSTSTSVTNAEVLAAIVKLIASINKQIRALQKQLRR